MTPMADIIPIRERRPMVTPGLIDTEQAVLGGILLRPALLGDVERILDARDFYAPKHDFVFEAMRALAERGQPIDHVTLELELERREKLEAIGGVAYLGELALRVPDPRNTLDHAATVRDASIVRQLRLLAGEVDYEAGDRGLGAADLRAMLERGLERIPRIASERAMPWRRAPDLAAEIWARKDEPWIPLTLSGHQLLSVRAGGLVVLIGGAGSGKSSLAANLLISHARDAGPAIVASIELPADEFAGRVVGIRDDAGWSDVLRGRVPHQHLIERLALPRLYILERRLATLENVTACVDAARAEYPGEPVLCAVDYAQLLGSRQTDARQRVNDVFERLDETARSKRVVIVALSQMGRAGAKAAREGDRIGVDSSDLGAESAAIERFATVTFTIGKPGEPRADGSKPVEVSIGKERMGEGDQVVPMSYWGRSGRWAVAGDATSAPKVREQRAIDKDNAESRKLELAILGLVTSAKEPVTRNEIKTGLTGKNARKAAAIEALVTRGDLVELARKAKNTKYPLIWTLERARAAGVPLATDVPGGAS